MPQHHQFEMDVPIRYGTREERFIDDPYFSVQQIGCGMHEEALI